MIDEQKQRYRSICAQHPDMLVFAQPWWLEAVCEYWDAAIVKNGDRIKGVWAYPVERKMGVGLLRTPKLTPYTGPQVFYPADMKASGRDGYEHDTIAELLKLLPETAVWDMALQPGLKQAGLFSNNGLHIQARQTFLLDLSPDETTLFANFKETTRRNIKQAEKDCVITSDPASLPLLYQYHKQTLGKKEKGIAHTEKELNELLAASIKNNAGNIYVATQGSKIEGIAWYVWDARCCYFLMGARNPDAESHKAMSLLHWQAIKDAKKMGQQYFDFEGSMDAGVERFFRSFGAGRELYMVLHKNNSMLWKAKRALLG